MKIYLALIIPVIVTLFFYVYNKHKFTWWEFFVPIIATLLLVIISKVTINETSTRCTEYWGSTVVSVCESEPYNYWQEETCSRQVPSGTDSNGNTTYTTEYYDCSHQVDVGPSWWLVIDSGEEIDISEKEYTDICNYFAATKNIIEAHKNHSSRDRCHGSSGTKFEGKKVGDISYVYKTDWGKTEQTRKTYVSKHNYKNKIKASDLSIFNMSLVDEKTVDSLGLFRYPKYTDGLNFPTILGKNIPTNVQDQFNKLNGKFGPTNQLRLWILVFEDKPMSVAQYQQNYWVNGNKNELVICIGVKNNEILWSHAFSWSVSADLTAEAQNKVLDLYSFKDSLVTNTVADDGVKKQMAGKKLPINIPASKDTIIKVKSPTPVLNQQTWDEYYQYLNDNLHKFKRREFEEFNYITVEPSNTATIIIYILSLIISVLTSIWNVNNKYL